MNVKLLEEVRDYILAHPEGYDQGQFCGTEFCIAGHAVMLSDPSRWQRIVRLPGYAAPGAAEDAGRDALDLTGDEADRLFDPFWNDVADGRFDLDGTERPQHVVAAERIDHFIATGGAE